MSSEQMLNQVLRQSKVSFFLMVPMQEMHRYLHNGLLYLVSAATDHYDKLIGLRYYNHELVLTIEMLMQAYYLSGRANAGLAATYGENFYGFVRSGLKRHWSTRERNMVQHVARFSRL